MIQFALYLLKRNTLRIWSKICDRQVICIHFSTQYAKSRAPRVHHARPGVFFEASTEGKENSVDFDTGTIRLDGCASFSRC